MSTEDLVRKIMELVYESKPVSSDPVVQRAAIRSGVWDLVQRYTDEFTYDDDPILRGIMDENERLIRENDDLAERLALR